MSHCGITDTGVATLAEALQVNSSLYQLEVWSPKLTKNGLKKLMELKFAARNRKYSFYDFP